MALRFATSALWLLVAGSYCNEAAETSMAVKRPQLTYEHAGRDETGDKPRDSNWLSGVMEQYGGTHRATSTITRT